MITSQEKEQLIESLLQVTSKDTSYLNQKSDSFIVWVDSTIPDPPITTGYNLFDVVTLLNKVEYLDEAQGIAEEIRVRGNSQVEIGVRADKSKRPLKS